MKTTSWNSVRNIRMTQLNTPRGREASRVYLVQTVRRATGVLRVYLDLRATEGSMDSRVHRASQEFPAIRGPRVQWVPRARTVTRACGGRLAATATLGRRATLATRGLGDRLVRMADMDHLDPRVRLGHLDRLVRSPMAMTPLRSQLYSVSFVRSSFTLLMDLLHCLSYYRWVLYYPDK